MRKYFYLAACLTLGLFSVRGNAQSCGNDSLYRLPYKNNLCEVSFGCRKYYRIAKRIIRICPKTWRRLVRIFPLPIWEGHEDELRMYWRAWEIAIGNIRNPYANQASYPLILTRPITGTCSCGILLLS